MADLRPAAPSATPSSSLRSYREIVSDLSSRVLDAHRHINVLQALRWDSSVEEAFWASRARELPRVGVDYWRAVDVGFDPVDKVAEVAELTRRIERELGASDDIGAILLKNVGQVREVVAMLECRGSRAFYTHSRRLYGSAKDRVGGGLVPARDLALDAHERLARAARHPALIPEDPSIPADRAAHILATRLEGFFGGPVVQVTVDGDVMADAAAGGDRVKLREHALFCSRDIDVLEVHEGWVHAATTLNGQAQPVARWLARGLPRTTTTQEGLAVLTEVLSGRSHIRRARRLNDRLLAVDKAEDGASFLDVFEWYRTQGYPEAECFRQSRRIFRGGVLEGGAPFTKDVCYAKGLAVCAWFIRSAMERGRIDWIPMLFAGKVAHEDVPVLCEHTDDGVVIPPIHLPPVFRNTSALAATASLGSLLMAP